MKLAKIVRIIPAVTLCALVVLAYNNCGKGYKSADFASFDESAGGGSPGPAPAPSPTPTPTPTPGPPRVLQVDRTNPQLYETVATPQSLDVQASIWIEPQYAYLDTRVASRGYVVLYLFGADVVTPVSVAEGLKVLAGFGLHVVCPDYAQDYGIATGCAAGDTSCKGLKRREAFEGTDYSPLITISRANSIEERFTKMLKFLVTTQPKGDWGYFLDANGQPRWDKVILAGHSHGASSAALIAKYRNVARVVSMSGPLDVDGTTPDVWLNLTGGATPITRYYTLSHTLDPQYPGHQIAWATMGLTGLGAVQDVLATGAVPPYANSHTLSVSKAYVNPHGSTGPNSVESRTDLMPVWRHLFIF